MLAFRHLGTGVWCRDLGQRAKRIPANGLTTGGTLTPAGIIPKRTSQYFGLNKEEGVFRQKLPLEGLQGQPCPPDNITMRTGLELCLGVFW